MWIVYLTMFIITVAISFLWARGIDNMKEKHPGYKGKDFLDWDDNKSHTEGNI